MTYNKLLCIMTQIDYNFQDYLRIILKNCMMSVGITANTKMERTCDETSSAITNKLCINGTKITKASNNTPVTKAATLHILLFKPSLKIDKLLLQLKPWNKRANVKVANAIVLAVIGFVAKPI